MPSSIQEENKVASLAEAWKEWMTESRTSAVAGAEGTGKKDTKQETYNLDEPNGNHIQNRYGRQIFKSQP